MQRWIGEIKRRRVLRVAALYLAAAWAAIQFSDIVLPALGLPEAAVRYVLLALALGFPLAMVFGWRYDITPEGVRRTASASDAELAANARLGTVDYVVLVALLGFAVAIVVSAGRALLDLTSQQPIAAVAPGAESTAPANSLAVLPFSVAGAAEAERHLGEGLAQDVLNLLAARRELQVMARTSSFAFVDSDTPPRELAARLGVRYLLQGSLEVRQGQATVAAELLDDKGFVRWRREFTQPLSAVAEMEASIADAVAATIRGAGVTSPGGDAVAGAAAGGGLAGRGTQNPQAWQAFLLARDFMQRRPANWQPSAIRQLELAVELDPRFAEAQATYAVVLAIMASHSVERREFMDRASAAANRAQVLAPDSAVSLAARGLLLQSQQPPDLLTAELVLRRAIDLDPANIDARNWLSATLAQLGRLAESQQVLEAAARIDPLNPTLQGNVAAGFSAKGEFPAARAALERLFALPQTPAAARFQIQSLLTEYGQLDAALRSIVDELGADPGALRRANPVERFAVSLGRLGLLEDAERVMQVAQRIDPRNPSVLAGRSMLYVMQGRFAEMDAHQARFIAEAGGNPRDLPGWMVMSLGGGHAIAGKADAAIALLEPIMERKPDPRLIDAQNDLALEFRQLLAHAYQQQGRAADAEDQLAAIDVALQSAWDQGFGRNPTAIARWAVNDSMRGRRESARTRLQQAVDSGWREIAMVRHDPRWASLRDDPEAGAVLQRVDADVARMRQAALETLAASGLLAQLQAG